MARKRKRKKTNNSEKVTIVDVNRKPDWGIREDVRIYDNVPIDTLNTKMTFDKKWLFTAVSVAVEGDNVNHYIMKGTLDGMLRHMEKNKQTLEALLFGDQEGKLEKIYKSSQWHEELNNVANDSVEKYDGKMIYTVIVKKKNKLLRAYGTFDVVSIIYEYGKRIREIRAGEWKDLLGEQIKNDEGITLFPY